MTPAYGKLLLTLPGGQQQEFDLGKPSVTLGRAMTNDIVLPDTRVSRGHARLDCGPEGCTVVDLGSANGIRVNGERVTTAVLVPGDTLTLGDSQLRFEKAGASFEPEMTMINTPAELEMTMAQMTLSVALNDTSQPRLVVKAPDQTWEVPLTGDALTIGRHNSNDLVLDTDRVSRRHARIERRGNKFVLRDLESTNGVWVNGDRVETHTLQNGDTFQIGRVQLMFKAAFAPAELTMVDQPLPSFAAMPRRPVVFVPGIMGSELWLGRERIWPNVKVLFTNPEILHLNSGAPLEPRGVVGEVVIVPNLIKLEQYSRLGDYLVEDLGYQRGGDLLEFAYDWRQDVRQSAQKLAEAIEAWPASKAPITLMAHSLGTLVSRYYVEKLGGKRRVERLILMGGPHRGAPKAAAGLVLGPNILPFGMLGDRLRQVMATFPTSYQILPTYSCALDQNGQPVDLLNEDSWLTPAQVPLLHQAREFRRELGMQTSVSTLCVFGYGMKTILRLNLQRIGQGWGNWSYALEPGGDSSVPEASAILDNVEIHPVQQYHGSLFVDNDVKMRLKLELTRRPKA